GVAQLEGSAARGAAGLLRLTLLSQLASSLPAFRASLARYEAFLDLARAAVAEGRSLGSREFQRLFPRGEAADLQLTLLPLLLPPGTAAAGARDQAVVRRLRDLSSTASDPKADALARLLAARDGKTIVFVQSRATARYLLRRLPGRRVAAVMGEAGLFGREVAGRGEVLRAFAPRAQGAPSPAPALETDVLIATDLLSEGLNLQDAVRVIHYDLPWSPARLTQRVGRIDRAGSPHARIETITLLPAPPLAEAIALERRLLGKARAQARPRARPAAPGPRPSTPRPSRGQSSAPHRWCGPASAPSKRPGGVPRIATGWAGGSFRGCSPPPGAPPSGASTPSSPGSTPSSRASHSA